VKLEAEQVLCRVHLSSLARHGSLPLYEWIVDLARREGLQGATVLKGFMGLKRDGTVLRQHALRLSQELPVVVELVDGPRHLERLLARLEPAMSDGVITLERAHVVLYRGGEAGGRARDTVPRCDVVATQERSSAAEVKAMATPEDGVLLRVFVGESDREAQGGRPLYEALLERAREQGLAGATVLRGPMGFGRHSRTHSAQLLERSADLPIVIEIVDAQDKVDAFLPVVDALVGEGLVTLEAVRVLRYGRDA
jgi:hypothetical protein